MPDSGVNQIHFTDTATVMLKRCDFFRIRRPEQDRTIATGPAGIVGRVAKIFNPILRELNFPSRSYVTNPKVEIADECGAPAVGGGNAVDHIGPVGGNTGRPRRVAFPTAVLNVEGNRAITVFESELGEGKREWCVVCSGCGR